MAKYSILYNPKAGNRTGEQGARKLEQLLSDDELDFTDVTQIQDMGAFLAAIPQETTLVLSGGDGTLNHFVNDADGLLGDRKVYYWPSGTGNDFLRDIGQLDASGPVEITQYLRDLPTVTVNGSTRKFLNGIGYGIDGYCCEVGDKLMARSDKPVNYTSIAIQGMLFHYRPTNARVTVDGSERNYRRVWLCPTMHGRFYGGGMMPAPKQDRLAASPRTLSCMVWHGGGRLSTLATFPSIFKGEHVKHGKIIEILTGRDITVAFDRPVALQIDGETVLGVTEYRVQAS